MSEFEAPSPEQQAFFTPLPQESKSLSADEILQSVPKDQAKQKSVESEAASKLAATKLFNASASLTGIVFWISVVHVVALAWFTRGFLLTRPVFEDSSSCEQLPFEQPVAPLSTCWSPQEPFKKVVLVVIDALRYDFVIPAPEDGAAGAPKKYYHNELKVLYEMSSKHPQNAFLTKFMADPPTTTLQRLKGLTTGSLPTFIDAGSNFAGTTIDEDNWVSQAFYHNKSTAFVGDDTWDALLGPYLMPSMKYPYDSLNVWDIHTVDNGVLEHIFPFLDNSDKWDIAVGHLLGVDHVGHRYGPNHKEMKTKLNQMDDFIRKLVASVDDSTLLVVMGDHGMDPKGDHGGDSDLELESTLWMYSKRPYFGRLPQHSDPKDRVVSQIDLVPTISLLLGLPIPYNSLGFPIAEAFLGPKSNNLQSLAQAVYGAASQIKRYRGNFEWSADEAQHADELWSKVAHAASTKDFSTLYESAEAYSLHSLAVFKQRWVSFDFPDMFVGLGAIVLSLIIVTANYKSLLSFQPTSVVLNVTLAAAIGSAAGFAVFKAGIVSLDLFSTVSGSAAIAVFASFGQMIVRYFSSKGFVPRSWWSVFALVLTALHAASFHSNSFTIWEDEIVFHLLILIGAAFFINSFRLESRKETMLSLWHSTSFMLLARVASFSKLCREEQGTSCITTFYTDSSSVNSPYALAGLAMLAILVPELVKSFYATSASYTGSAPVWIGVGLRVTLLLASIYWLFDGIEIYGWDTRDLVPVATLRSTKILVARVVLGAALVAGNYGWYVGALCIKVDVRRDNNLPSKVKASIMGYSNVYGSYYFLVLLNVFAAAIVVTKPLGGILLALLLYHILTLVELLQLHNLRNTMLAPVALGLLGSAYFFATGHHATIPAIQWEVGFIPVQTITFPFTHIALVLNTFAPAILTALAVPLAVLWKIPPNKAPISIHTRVTSAVLGVMVYYTIITISSTVSVFLQRRHLMLWKIFAPRYMLSGVALGVVDLTLVVAMLCSGRAIGYVNSIFG